ncbi:MAG: tetratricopeptide repeat protein, partial [Planctomycetes bacterium]|nr:tetratricopeptide repeat protein [Planctomycetota bacterium]
LHEGEEHMASVAKAVRGGLCSLVVLIFCAPLSAGPLDEMSLERWAKLKEAERYQLNVAEKLYREKHYKVAGDEYEKFLKLYDKSEGAAFAQLKWSHCQIEQRKLNSAIKDGYQSVIDYFPESPEAPIAALLIGRTYQSMGDTKLAKKAFFKTVSTYPKHFSAVMARLDLVDIAAKESDPDAQTTLLKELTFDVERKGPTVDPCVNAARLLARLQFNAANFEDGIKALGTTCKEEDLPSTMMHPAYGGLPAILLQLSGSMDEPTKKRSEKLADAAAAWLKTQVTAKLADPKLKPKAVETWYLVADVRHAARQPEKEKAVLDEMNGATPVDDVLLGRIALWFKENKQMEKARATYAKFKDAAEGQGQIAASFMDEKQYDKAVEIYRRLAVGDPKTAPKWLTAAAWAYRQGGKPDQAIAVYQELLVADAPKAPEYHFQIAETLFRASRWKESITAYRGTDHFPQNYQNMAMANRQLKQYDEAISLYTQIMSSSAPNASWALYQIAATHEQAGRAEEAIKVFKQVCDKFPKTQEGSNAHSHLNQKYKISVTLGGAKD